MSQEKGSTKEIEYYSKTISWMENSEPDLISFSDYVIQWKVCVWSDEKCVSEI